MMLHGNITVTKRLRRHAVWDREPKCYGAAWIDLIMLANDAERIARLNGEDVAVARGQLCWSIRSLAQEWNRSDEWTSRFLRFCQDEVMIKLEIKKGRHTLITILNYETYNPISAADSGTEPGTVSAADSGTEPGTVSAADSGTEPGQKGEGGKGTGNGELRKRVRATKPDVSLPGRFQKKNAARNHTDGASPAQALFLLDRELADVIAEIAEHDELNKPVPGELKQRRRDLQKKRAVLADGRREGGGR